MTVCLTMIVKNEAHVIRRCLESHKGVIDYWVIVDTGSTDHTKDIIRRVMEDIPGELHERSWVDFGHNRTEALQLAKGKADYILVNDADHIWHGELPKILTNDCYAIQYRYGNTHYGVTCLLADRLDWRYVGVIHEYVESVPVVPGMRAQGLNDCYIEVRHEGARSLNPETYRKDAEILERALEKEPNNQRYVFYLAQSYRDCGQLDKAIALYRRRIGMPGWDQEEWYARYQVAMLSDRLGEPIEKVSRAYLEAFQARPTRAEPLYRLAFYHRLRSEWSLAYLYASEAALLPPTTDGLFVEESIYAWQALDELAIAAFYSNHHDVGRNAAQAALKRPHPPQEKQRLEANLAFYTQKAVDMKAA